MACMNCKASILHVLIRPHYLHYISPEWGYFFSESGKWVEMSSKWKSSSFVIIQKFKFQKNKWEHTCHCHMCCCAGIQWSNFSSYIWCAAFIRHWSSSTVVNRFVHHNKVIVTTVISCRVSCSHLHLCKNICFSTTLFLALGQDDKDKLYYWNIKCHLFTNWSQSTTPHCASLHCVSQHWRT